MKKDKKIELFVRKNILELKPYSSARDEFKGKAGIFLDANENPFGSPGKKKFNRYPDPLQLELKTKIADWKNVKTGNIFLGNGSDEAIDILLRIFCEPGKDEIIICRPTYGMYEVSAAINNVKVDSADLNKDFQLDVKKIVAKITTKTKAIFICSPNNPTGNLMKPESVFKLLKSFNGIVVVDEAYIDFAPGKSLISEIKKYPNLVILQTFSKAFGLARLRLGMAFADSNIIVLMNKVKPPYNISQFTIQEGMKAVNKQDWMKGVVNSICSLRKKMKADWKNLNFVEKIYPSDANFLLVKVKNAEKLYNYLVKNGVIVRNRSNQKGCENCLRITIGTPLECKRTNELLKKFRI